VLYSKRSSILFIKQPLPHLTTPSLSYSKTFRRRRNHSLPHGDLPLSEVCRLRSALSSSFRPRYCRGLGRAVCLPSNHPCICEAMRLKLNRDYQQYLFPLAQVKVPLPCLSSCSHSPLYLFPLA